MSEQLHELRKTPHWSFSSLNSFINVCSLQWAFKYVYKLEPEYTSVHLVFGSAFHKTAGWIAMLRQKNTCPMPEEVQNVFSEIWKLECKANEKLKLDTGEFDQLNITGRKMVECLNSQWPEKDIVAINQVFSVPLPGISKPLIGEIDCIVRDDNFDTILIDWKTSDRKWPENKADKDLQATCFIYAYKQMNKAHIIDDCLFRYDVVTKAKEPSYTQHYTYRSSDDFIRLFHLIKTVERAISAESFLPNENGFYCSSCQYASACKSWHRKQAKSYSLPIAV